MSNSTITSSSFPDGDINRAGSNIWESQYYLDITSLIYLSFLFLSIFGIALMIGCLSWTYQFSFRHRYHSELIRETRTQNRDCWDEEMGSARAQQEWIERRGRGRKSYEQEGYLEVEEDQMIEENMLENGSLDYVIGIEGDEERRPLLGKNVRYFATGGGRACGICA